MGKTKEGQYEIFFITEKTNKPGYFEYEQHHNEIDKKSIIKHVPTNKNYENAWLQLGFLKKDDEFFKLNIEHDENNSNSETNSLNTETSEDESIGSYDELSDQSEDTDVENDSIVTENHDETFTESTCNCNTCIDMRQCQQSFKNWCPKDESERKIKLFMDRLEYKVKHELL